MKTFKGGIDMLKKVGLGFLLLTGSAFADTAPKLNHGDTAWMLVASSLVMLMTIPGLAFFYGGMAKKKDLLNTIALSFMAYAITSVIWVLYAYSLAFGADVHGIIGNLQYLFMNGVTSNTIHPSTNIPEFIYAGFQLAFAAIAVALISGSLIERLKFSAWLVIVPLCISFVYVPVAHWVWGGGWLAKLGAVDFAGGIVIHITAGFGGLAGALVLGKRKNTQLVPNNVAYTVLGAGLLWFGWFGFNAGSEVAADGIASSAWLVTNTAGAIAAISWMITEWKIHGKPTTLGIASGAIAGLAGITPASGYVNIMGAMVIGILAGVLPVLAVSWLKPKLGYDDALDVFGVHGVASFFGVILTGVFADPSINPSEKGILYGNSHLLIAQIIASISTMIYAFVVSFVIFKIVDITMGIRIRKEEEIEGLDSVAHGETAYN
ncbi:ammonium transporter [Hydrogenobaculum sp. Y04AAS1]|uniref:ammonium transporter n=1 Tax=Hydrogenobaculum sp. (strain Y04AAS1) TaxID=380749 RepID=UPI00017BBDFA|nr:ammonium transporter [Hydrogenobaculum sp. Y04AAS1]